MDNASKNAKEVSAKLTILYNRVRQVRSSPRLALHSCFCSSFILRVPSLPSFARSLPVPLPSTRWTRSKGELSDDPFVVLLLPAVLRDSSDGRYHTLYVVMND